MAFFGLSIALWGVSRCRGSVAGRGDCKTCLQTWGVGVVAMVLTGAQQRACASAP